MSSPLLERPVETATLWLKAALQQKWQCHRDAPLEGGGDRGDGAERGVFALQYLIEVTPKPPHHIWEYKLHVSTFATTRVALLTYMRHRQPLSQ